MKFYKRDPDRALSGMIELTLKQRGAYNSLIDLLYSRDGDVPDDDIRVAKMISCHWREWKAIKIQLMALGKVWSEGGKLHARRVQDTIKEAASFSQEQSKRASKGWQTRRKDNQNNEGKMPLGNACAPILTPTPIPRVDANASTTREINLEFENEFWPKYLHKVGKRDAKKAYANARKRADKQPILDGLDRYIASKPPDRNWCNPSTFLNQDRWTDEPANQFETHKRPEKNWRKAEFDAAKEATRKDFQQWNRPTTNQPAPSYLLESETKKT